MKHITYPVKPTPAHCTFTSMKKHVTESWWIFSPMFYTHKLIHTFRWNNIVNSPEICINPSGVETKIFQANWVNTMAADDLAPSFARPSAVMELTVCNLDIMVFIGSKFQ